MTASSGITASQEYETLRSELLESKRYVFERPLLLAALALAGAGQAAKDQLPLLAATVTVLFLFNFWFTTNRLISSSRIVAYIQLVLEEHPSRRGPGWETCLRFYRKWLKSREGAAALIDAGLDRAAAPDALGYYPPIYWLHIGPLLVLPVGMAYVAAQDPTAINSLCAAVVLLVAAVAMFWAVRHPPSRMALTIERNRVIWTHALAFMNAALQEEHAAASALPNNERHLTAGLANGVPPGRR